ncbi:MAG: hypothetical protein KME13_17265 [Myxacorys californica WJT36-NPBG1]|jgi:hypothetical protein|nr:hypothetical protein [Myxacorys californica WJT36-NPBG1]
MSVFDDIGKAARKVGRAVDPTNRNSEVRQTGRAIDPFNPNSVVREAGRRIDPTNSENWGHDTDRPEVERALRQGDWMVTFGKEFSHSEYLELAAAAATSVATENPSPLLAYLEGFAYESYNELTQKAAQYAPQITQYISVDRILSILAHIITTGERHSLWNTDGIEAQMGVAVYHRGELVAGERVSTPNTFQPYIRIKNHRAVG